jgi:hypothetical protein
MGIREASLKPGHTKNLQGTDGEMISMTRRCVSNLGFKWLDVAYQERDLGLPSLKTDFLLDPTRTDLRLTELGLP